MAGNREAILKRISVVVTMLFCACAAADERKNIPVWQWSLEQVQASTSQAKAGKSLKPREWPEGKRVAVLFSFDADNQTTTLSSMPNGADPDLLTMSLEEYGSRVGVERIVNLLDKHNIPATFFIPAVALQLAPQMIDIIKEPGHHEFAMHGWIHERAGALSLQEQKKLFQETADYIAQVTGQKPVGYRAPWGDLTEHTFPLLDDMGFLYDSSLLADDSPYQLVVNGKSSDLIELPVNINLEDSVLDVMNTFSAGITQPRDILNVYKDAFDVMHEEGGMMVFVLHPHVTGRPSRIVVLKELIEYMKAKGDVWFATHADAATYVKQQSQQ